MSSSSDYALCFDAAGSPALKRVLNVAKQFEACGQIEVQGASLEEYLALRLTLDARLDEVAAALAELASFMGQHGSENVCNSVEGRVAAFCAKSGALVR